MENTECDSEGYYHSLSKAKTACSSDYACIAINDDGCDGIRWYTCSTGIKKISSSCVWKKGIMGNMLSF